MARNCVGGAAWRRPTPGSNPASALDPETPLNNEDSTDPDMEHCHPGCRPGVLAVQGTSRAPHAVIVNLPENAARRIKRRPALRYHRRSGEPLGRISWKIRRITADLRGGRVGSVRRCHVNGQAVLQLEAIRWVLGNDMRHIDIRHKRQSRITIDDGEYLVRRIIGHFVSTIVAAVRRRARLAVPGSNAPTNTLWPVIIRRKARRDIGNHRRRCWRIGSQIHRGQVENHHARTTVPRQRGISRLAWSRCRLARTWGLHHWRGQRNTGRPEILRSCHCRRTLNPGEMEDSCTRTG